MRAAKVLDNFSSDEPDVVTGIKIVRRALQEPLRRIAENAGTDGAVVVGEVEELKGNKGFNAATGDYEDLVPPESSIPPRLYARHCKTPPRLPDCY